MYQRNFKRRKQTQYKKIMGFDYHLCKQFADAYLSQYIDAMDTVLKKIAPIHPKRASS
jgi:hypothetical protein